MTIHLMQKDLSIIKATIGIKIFTLKVKQGQSYQMTSTSTSKINMIMNILEIS